MCAYVFTEALQLQSEAVWLKHGRQSVQLEELMRSLAQWSNVTSSQRNETKLQGAYFIVWRGYAFS